MASNVFLAACDPEYFDRTVRSPIDLSDDPDRPPALADVESVRLWGAHASGNEQTYFERMEPGDLVLFYHDGEYVGTGRIGTTFADEDAWTTAFWNDTSFDLIYTIEDFTPVSVPRAAVNRIFDYSEGYSPGGLLRVADDRVTNRPAAIKRAIERYSERHE